MHLIHVAVPVSGPQSFCFFGGFFCKFAFLMIRTQTVQLVLSECEAAATSWLSLGEEEGWTCPQADISLSQHRPVGCLWHVNICLSCLL